MVNSLVRDGRFDYLLQFHARGTIQRATRSYRGICDKELKPAPYVVLKIFVRRLVHTREATFEPYVNVVKQKAPSDEALRDAMMRTNFYALPISCWPGGACPARSDEHFLNSMAISCRRQP